MSTEIGTLVSRFTADTSGFESGNRRVESGMRQTARLVTDAHRQMHVSARGLRGGMQELGASIGVLQGPLGGVAGRLSSTATLLGSVTGATGGFVAAFGLATAAAVGLATGIYTLATNAATVSDEIGDMADKINFSVRTLSGLQTAAEASGGSLQGLSNALGIFDRNMEAAAQGQERLSTLFKGLKIDTTDNEKAFRQVAEILVKLGGTSQQTALALELFGRSGKDVLGIIKTTGGNVEEFIKQMEAMGIVISEEGVKKADAFDKQMIIVKAQLAAVTRQLGEEFMPMVSQTAGNLSKWLSENQGQIQRTIKLVGALLNALTGLVTYIKLNSPVLFIIDIVTMGAKLLPSGGSGQAITRQQQRNVFTVDPATGRRIYSGNAPYDDAGEFAIAGGAGQRSEGARNNPPRRGAKTEQEMLADRIRQLLERGTGGGGGGGGGGDAAAEARRLAEIRLKIILDGLQAEEEANRRSLTLRRTDFNQYAEQYRVIEDRRHQAVIKGLDAEEAAAQKLKKGRAAALLEIEGKRKAEDVLHDAKRNQILDERGKILDQIENFLRDQDRAIDSLTNSTGAWDSAYRQLVDTLKAEGVTMEENTRKRIEANIAHAKELELVLSVTRARRVADQTRDRFETREGRDRPPWLDLGGGSTVGGEPATTTRGRVVTAEAEVLREQYREHLENMRRLAYDLTNVLDRAVYDGLEGGLKRGFQSLTLGILDLLQNVFLRKLEDILASTLSSIGSGSSGGGGFWSKLPSLILGAFGGAFGGGGSGSTGGLGTAFAGAFASGGTIPMGQYGVVHDNEKVVATPYGALVIPNQTTNNNTSGTTVINNIYISEKRASDSYKSPRARRELADQLVAALQSRQ